MIDKDYCCSSYLAFRYIERDGAEFAEGLHHVNPVPRSRSERHGVRDAAELDAFLTARLARLSDTGCRAGLFLSGGMDSAILASYMRGCDAYTFRFEGGDMYADELARAEYYADSYGLRLHYVDIDWHTVEEYLPAVLRAKGAPVHSIEPQLLQGAVQAAADGIDTVVLGEGCDATFGGLDGLLAREWRFDDFRRRYMFTDPSQVLKHPADTDYLFERYRTQGDGIDYQRFIAEVFAVESAGSYFNAFGAAGMRFDCPYSDARPALPLDLERIRRGDSKYIIRELFSMKYPSMPVPEKLPMPRPVDRWFASWQGPSRPEFLENIDMSRLSGNSRWQLYCLERFLNMLDRGELHEGPAAAEDKVK